ncbi:MAG TPA: hypothetical protein VF161_01520 [Steroidobacteraceae bacterium]|jgi:hypothetical protein
MRSILALLALSMTLTAVADTPSGKTADTAPAPSAKLVSTQAALRDLWVGHIFWVREVARGLMEKDQSAVKTAEQQAVDNARKIAGAIEPFYGKAASDQLFKLLAGHYTAVKSHASATAAKSSADAKKAVDELTANANEIAKFLSGANPYLPEATLRSLLAAHGGHHVQQNQQLAAKDFAAEARTWETMKEHIYKISDALVGALAKQFPEKF